MQHSFDVEIAKNIGIAEAILMQNLWFWIEKNKANEKNFFDGKYWTYNSTRAFTKLFPYLTQRQIQNALKKLKEKGIIETGNYNKSAYDRTSWYAFTKMGDSIMQKCKMEEPNLSNGLCKNVEPIPDIKTNINTDNTNDNIFEFLEKNLGRTLGPIEIEKVSQWEDNELTRYAIKKSILNGKYNISYIDKIIYFYKKNGIVSVQQAIQSDEEFKNRKLPKKEKEPEWFDKDVKSDLAKVESQEEMKELLKEFM